MKLTIPFYYDLVDYEKYNALDKKIYNFSTDGHD